MILTDAVMHRGDVNERYEAKGCCAGFFECVVAIEIDLPVISSTSGPPCQVVILNRIRTALKGCNRNCSSVSLVIPALMLVEPKRDFSVIAPSSSGLDCV